MALTLEGAKPILQQDLYNAFYNAYMTQYASNNLKDIAKFDNDMKEAMEKKAKDFSEQLSKDMAEAIYKFVKEIGIQATVTGTIIAPSGPCTGSIPSTNFTII